MKKLIVTLLAPVLLAGCNGDAIESTQKGDFKVELLFEQNGCKMYRFMDGARSVYWSDCRGKTSYDYTTQSGKSRVSHHMETDNTGR